MSQGAGLRKPFTLENSGRWFGSDGSWSTFYVHVGMPAQHFHILPSFSGQTIYFPLDVDCQRLNTTDCGLQRGVEVFNSRISPGFQPSASSNWTELGNYSLGLGIFGSVGSAKYGYDTFGPGTSRSTESIKLEKTVVAAYISPDIWLGQLGLSMYAINISETEQPHSVLSRMKEDGYIPRLSFGHQAGAPYHSSQFYVISSSIFSQKVRLTGTGLTKEPGSLVLGVYDRSLQANRTLTLTSNQDIIVGLQSISAQFSNGTTTILSSTGILSTITTNTAEVWLPRAICDVIESAFNLTYFAPADRYALTQAAHIGLRKANPTITFELGKSTSGGDDTLSMSIPSAAFDLQAKYPIFSEQTNYFPLRRAANDSQYALGRVFLQEVYLSVDFEQDIFNISQAAFNSPPLPADLITIEPVNRSSCLFPQPEQPKDQKLHTRVIIGIAAGAIAFILILTAMFWWRDRKQKHVQSSADAVAIGEAPNNEKKDPIELPGTDYELRGLMVPEMHGPRGESDVPPPVFELPSEGHMFLDTNH